MDRDVAPVNVFVRFAPSFQIAPSTVPAKDTLPVWPDASSSNSSANEYAALVTASGASAPAIDHATTAVATMDWSPDAVVKPEFGKVRPAAEPGDLIDSLPGPR